MWFHKHINQAKQSHLNMRIARAHELATQLVGIQLAAANLLALAISMASIVAGCVTYAVLNKPGAWPFWLAAGGIGCGLALLIEGMTLGALIRIRLANKQIRAIVLQLEAERDQALAAGKIVGRWKFWRRKRYATRNYRKSRRSSIPLAVIGASASATAGGLFYHQMLASLGWYESIGVSALFALIVTGTFVSSELYKDLQEEAVREGFRGGSLSEEALREETYRQTNQAVAVEVSSYLTSQGAKDSIREAAGQLLGDVLSELRKRSAERVGHVVIAPAIQENIHATSSHRPPATGQLQTVNHDQPTTGKLPAPKSQPDTTLTGQAATSQKPPTSGQPATASNQQPPVTSPRPVASPTGKLSADNRPALPESSQRTTGQPAKLGMIDQMMLDAIEKQASEAERSELLALADAQPLAELTRTLQKRYSDYASYITESRVERVMAAFKSNQQQAAIRQLEQTIDPNTGRPDTKATTPTGHETTGQQNGQAATGQGSNEATGKPGAIGEHPGQGAKIIDMTGHRTHRPMHPLADTGQQDTILSEQPAIGQQNQEHTQQDSEPQADSGKQDNNGHRVAAYRAEHQNATQSQVAKALGLSERTVRRHWKQNTAAS